MTDALAQTSLRKNSRVPAQRVLATGAGGLLGGRLASLLAARFELTATRRTTPPPEGLAAIEVDLLSPDSVERVLETTRPDYVVHAAAIGDSVRCEADPAAAEQANAVACASVARACRARGIRLVTLSTDLVFAGHRAFSSEADEASPILEYGRTKLRGELATLEAHPEACIARVALVLGRGYGSRATASESIAWAARRGQQVRLFADEFRTPVDAESVADGVTRLLLTPGARGVYHFGGPERLSRFELGLRTVRALGLPESCLLRAHQKDAGGAPRPADTSLDSSRALRELSWRPRALDCALRESRTEPS